MVGTEEGSAGLESSPVSLLVGGAVSRLVGVGVGAVVVEVGSAGELGGEDSRLRSPLVAGF
jgi:hypothetical protein